MIVLSPRHAFSSLFRCKLWSAGKGNIKTLEILPLLHIETAKSAEPWNKIRDLSEISRGGGGEGVVNFKFGFGNEVTHPCNGSEIC